MENDLVKLIRENSAPLNWNHVRSECNPAIKNDLWWHGPHWLSLPQQNWPEPVNVARFDTPSEVSIEYKINAVHESTNIEIFVENQGNVSLLEYTNSFSKILRIFTYVHRFIKICKQRALLTKEKEKKNGKTVQKTDKTTENRCGLYKNPKNINSRAKRIHNFSH